MSLASQGGLSVARQITAVYKQNSNVRSVIVSGSVARGYADGYSDLEIGVFWTEPPTDHERQSLIAQLDGEVWSFTSAARDATAVVNDHIGLRSIEIGGRRHTGLVMIDTKHATVAGTEQCMRDVLEQYDTDVSKQVFLAAIEDGISLDGAEQIETWQAQLKTYPLHLAIKMIQENLWCGSWFIPQAYVDRDDCLVLYQHIVWMQQSILKILAGLNRRYYRSAEHKWMDATIGRFVLAPIDLAARMKMVFRVQPVEGVKEMLALVHETIDLVERHCPEVNQIAMFAEHPEITTAWARRRWEPQAPYTLLEIEGEQFE